MLHHVMSLTYQRKPMNEGPIALSIRIQELANRVRALETRPPLPTPTTSVRTTLLSIPPKPPSLSAQLEAIRDPLTRFDFLRKNKGALYRELDAARSNT
jgi:hypothetical protein